MTPCHSLTPDQQMLRLAAHRWSRPEVTLKAGVCQLCGHPTPIAFRAVKVLSTFVGPDGKMEFQCAEAVTGSTDAAEMERKIASGAHVPMLLDQGYSILRQCACPEMQDEELWKAAGKHNEDKRRAMREEAQRNADSRNRPQARTLRRDYD